MKYAWPDEQLCALPGAEKDFKPAWQWFRHQLRAQYPEILAKYVQREIETP